MSGRDRRGSLRTHEEQLRQALSCITTPVIATRSALRVEAHTYSVMLNNAEPSVLRSRPITTLTVQQDILLQPRIDRGRAAWRLNVVGYAYTFRDRERREILVFHWHPTGFSDIIFPHIHIGGAMIADDAPVRPTDFYRTHIPIGQVYIEDVVRFAISELGVTSLRNDWDAVLAGIARQRGQVT